MEKIISILSFGVLAASITASAALPPQYQRIRELNAILNNEAVMQTLMDSRYREFTHGMIDGISLKSRGAEGQLMYEIKSGRCTLNVVLEYYAARDSHGRVIVGPARFNLFPQKEMNCI